MPDHNPTQPCPPDMRCREDIPTESDNAFVERQFRQSIEALERVGALALGEFDRLARTSAHREEERVARAAHHHAVAVAALAAVLRGELREEEFNIWSGRRKEHGEAIKARFEAAYEKATLPGLCCRRGALTGIVRSYQHLISERINAVISACEEARTPDALLQAERQAVEYGFLEFELYTNGHVAGWPSFMRSTGRFCGTARLRELCDLRQSELPMSPEQAEAQIAVIGGREPVAVGAGPSVDAEDDGGDASSPLQRMFSGVGKLFRRP